MGEPIDLAIVAIPPDAVMGVLEECAAGGVRSALVLTIGFAEQGGAYKELQDRMTALARPQRDADLRAELGRAVQRGGPGGGHVQPGDRAEAGPRR